MWSWNIDLDDDLEKAKKKTQAMYGASTPTMRDSAGTVIQPKTGLSTAQIKQDWDAANPWARRNQGSAAPVPPAAPATPWKVSMDGLMMKNTPAPKFVPLPTKPAAEPVQNAPWTGLLQKWAKPSGQQPQAAQAPVTKEPWGVSNSGLLGKVLKPANVNMSVGPETSPERRAARLAELAKSVTFEDLLHKQGPLSPDEEALAKQIIKEREKEYNGRLASAIFQLKSVSEEDQAYSMATTALKNRVSDGAALGMGFFNSVSFKGLDRASVAQDRIAEEWSKTGDSPVMAAAGDIAQSHGGQSVAQIAAQQNPFAYGAGNFVGESAKYATFAPLIEGIPLVGKATKGVGEAVSKLTGGRVSAAVAERLAAGRIVDLPFDLFNAAMETDSPEEFARHLGVNQAMGLGADIGFEVLAAGWRAIKEAAKTGRLKQYVDPENIKDAEIDRYLEKVHSGDAPKIREGQIPSVSDREAHLLGTMKQEYQGHADPELRAFAEEALSTPDKNWRNLMNFDLAPVNEQQAQDVYRLTGIDVSGYQNNVKGNSIVHINERHGINGQHDASMADMDDVARLGYALEHYDTVERLFNSDGTPVKSKEFMNKDNSPADVLQFTKRINGTLYIVEAVPDTKAKKMRVVTAYISPTKKGAEQVLYMPEGPQLTSKTPLASVPDASISGQPPKINGQSGGNSGGGFDPLTAPLDVANQARARAEETMKAFLPENAAKNVPTLPTNFDEPFTDDFGQVIQGAKDINMPEDWDLDIDAKIKPYRDILQELTTPEQVKNFRDGALAQLQDLENMRQQAVDAYADYIYNYQGKGVQRVPIFDNRGETVNQVRQSLNEPWYSKYAGRKLSRADSVALAERVVDNPRMQSEFPSVIPDDLLETVNITRDMRDELRMVRDTLFSDPNYMNTANPHGYGNNTVGAAQSAFQYKQQVSKSYDNTFQKTPLFTQAEKELANAAGMDKTFSYDVISEKRSMAEAAQRFALDAAGEMEDLPKKGSWGSSDLDTAMLILEQKRDQWRKTGNHDDLVKWAKVVQEKGTEAGQMIQAFAKYSRTPEGTIIKAEGAIADYAKKLREANPKLFNAIDEFAEELERVSLDFRYDMPADPDAATAKLKNAVEEFAKKHSKVRLDDETTDEIIRAIKEGRGGKDAIGDVLQAAEGIPQLSAEDVGNVLDLMAKAEDFPLYSKERYKLENQAWKIVADHFDSSFMDKWNAWRYMAMLGNTRTHIRNTVGNTVFGAVVTIKDRLGAVLEGVTDHTARAFGGKGIERTKSIFAPLDRELSKAAKNDFNDMYALVAGNGKYNPSNMIRDNMTVFKTKWLEKLRKLNLGALEAEDAVALKARYADSLAGWLKANGYGVDIFKDTSETAQETLTWARAYAIEQAQKATFRDDSQLATALSNMSRSSKAANVIIEGIVPFKKTPINIVKRGIEYSPAGLVKGVSEAISAVKTGRKTAAEAIDHIASGLTGTGIMYLGYKLAESGLITGSGSEDSRERGFDAMTGNQNYALVIDGKSYTLDWAAPAALPLFVGVEYFKTKGSGLTSAGLLDSVTKITEPALDMTMLQGLNDTIKSAAYDQTGPLASIGVNAVSNYATQAVPTLFGQVARAVDDTRRSTYYGGGAFLDRFLPENIKKAAAELPGVQGIIDATLPKPVDIAAQKTMAKIPGLSMLLNPKVDQWGREQKNQGGSFGGRLAYNTLSPGYYSEQNYTDVDREIERLYGESGEKGVLPGYAAKTIAQKDAEGNKETKRLSAGEFVRFAKEKGGAAYESLGVLFQSEAYQAAGDDDKAQMVADIYEYTNAAAKTGVSNYKPSGWVEKAMEAKKDGIALEEYVLCRNVLTPLKHNVEKNEKLLEMDMNPKRKETLYKYFVSDSESSRKKIDAFRAVGLDMDDYLTAQIEYAHIDDEGGSAQEKATAFYQWLDGQGLSDREYQAVAQSMPFFQMFPAKPQAYRVGLASDKVQAAYTSLNKNYGISEDNFMAAFNAVQDVEGVKDRSGKTISGSQKKARFRALAELPGWNASGARLFLIAVYGYKDEKWT